MRLLGTFTFVRAFAVAVVCLLPAAASAQTPTPTPAPTTTAVSPDEADLAITARVTARELLFRKVPNPRVEFPGNHERRTLWEAERENLPEQVQPGVTYRDLGIRLRITSVFADIDRIVAEALGEVPVREEATPPAAEPSAPVATPPAPSEQRPTPPTPNLSQTSKTSVAPSETPRRAARPARARRGTRM